MRGAARIFDGAAGRWKVSRSRRSCQVELAPDPFPALAIEQLAFEHLLGRGSQARPTAVHVQCLFHRSGPVDDLCHPFHLDVAPEPAFGQVDETRREPVPTEAAHPPDAHLPTRSRRAWNSPVVGRGVGCDHLGDACAGSKPALRR
jgi:hypothetical protein